ncbi:hypothetical protein E2C01_035534 [Portunus trituberculatus]|uniref:Uncharacterized protein n=1 Tax=Portunus trituberculatus TaxID=210409 RepID=A0A5B7FA13_PORTR|nr:hypothetical protein [Portunus trituberculatus]
MKKETLSVKGQEGDLVYVWRSNEVLNSLLTFLVVAITAILASPVPSPSNLYYNQGHHGYGTVYYRQVSPHYVPQTYSSPLIPIHTGGYGYGQAYSGNKVTKSYTAQHMLVIIITSQNLREKCQCMHELLMEVGVYSGPVGVASRSMLSLRCFQEALCE